MYANRIREIRRARGVSATELAYKASLSTSTLFRYERGEAEPPLSVARAMATVLDSTADELYPTGQPAAA